MTLPGIEFYGDTFYTSKPIMILISGKAGVGKTTLANILNKKFNTYELDTYITHFAKGVKHIARLMMWDGNKGAKGRNLLQKIGAIGRKYDEDCWVNYLLHDIDAYTSDSVYDRDVVIVDDWRFPNEELSLIKRKEFIIFTVNFKQKIEKF